MVKKLTFLLLLLIFYHFYASAPKQNVVDSLLSKLSNEKIDTVKVNILSDLVVCYINYFSLKTTKHSLL